MRKTSTTILNTQSNIFITFIIINFILINPRHFLNITSIHLITQTQLNSPLKLNSTLVEGIARKCILFIILSFSLQNCCFYYTTFYNYTFTHLFSCFIINYTGRTTSCYLDTTKHFLYQVW